MKQKYIACLLAVAVTANLALPVTASEVLIVEDTEITEALTETDLLEQIPEISELPETEEFEKIEDLFVEEIEVSMELSLEIIEDEDWDIGGETGEEEENTCGPNLTWDIDASETILTISGTGSMDDWDNNDTYAPWIEYSSTIQMVYVESGVTTIGDYAFEFCEDLGSISLPSTITEIGDYAFADCQVLSSVPLPDGLNRIGDGAFSGCYDLDVQYIPESVRYIGDFAFAGSAISSCEIPYEMTEINASVFEDCEFLETVTLPSTLQQIGDDAFNGCISLKGTSGEGVFLVPERVGYIGEGAFAFCESLEFIQLPPYLSEINSQSFYACTGLMEIQIPESVISIGDEAFLGCDTVDRVKIPREVKYVGIDAFAGCDHLMKVYFSGDFPQMPGDVFGDDDNQPEFIRELEIYYPISNETWTEEIIKELPTEYEYVMLEWLPDGIVWELESGVLTISQWEYDLEEFESVSDIPWYEDKDTVKKVIIEDGVEKIGDYAFWNMLNISAIWIEGDGILLTIADRACFNVTATVFVDSDYYGLMQSYGGALNWVQWNLEKEILTVKEKIDAGYPTGHQGDAPWSEQASKIERIVLQDVTRLDHYWFSDCMNLKHVEFSDTISSIGDYAFSGCLSMKGITIPKTVTSLGQYIFLNSSLENIVFEGETLPGMLHNTFKLLEATAYYPMKNTVYSKEQMSAYGDWMSWIGWKKIPYADEADTFHLIVQGYGKIGNFEDSVNADDDTLIVPWESNALEKEITIGDGITHIGDYAFSEFIFVNKVTIGKDIEEIGDQAFRLIGSGDGIGHGTKMYFAGKGPAISADAFGDRETCEEIWNRVTVESTYVDAYYDSNKSGWQETISKIYDNLYVSWIRSEEVELYEDGWHQKHEAENFALDGTEESGYYFSAEDEWILFRNMTRSEQKNLKVAKGHIGGDELRYNLNGAGNTNGDTYTEFGGICYGLAHVAALSENGILSAGVVREADSSVSDDMKSLLQFYFLQQNLPEIKDAQKEYSRQSQTNQLKKLSELLQNVTDGRQNMVSISFAYLVGMKQHKHAVLAYGEEEGKFYAGDKWYNHRVMIYDVNAYGSTQYNYHTVALYYNDDKAKEDQWCWCMPAYSAYSSTNRINILDKTNTAKLVMVCAANEYMNAVDHSNGARATLSASAYMYSDALQSSGAAPQNTYLSAGNKDFTIQTDKKSYVISNGLLNGTTDGDDSVLILSQIYGAGDDNPVIALPADEGDCTVSFAEPAAYAMHYQNNSYLTAGSEQPGSVSFSENGKVELKLAAKGSGRISVVSDDTSFAWDEMTVTVEDAEDMTVQMTDEGLVVQSNNLQNLTVEKEENGKTSSESFSAEDKVLVTSESNELTVKTDPDQDGVYDTELTPHVHTYQPSFKWDAVNQCKLIMKCPCGYTQNAVCSVKSTVKEATCTAAGKKTYHAEGMFGGKKYTTSKEVLIAKKPHEYGSWTVVKAPTAVAVGTQIRKCKNCTASQSGETAKLQPTMTLNASGLVLQTKQKTTALKVSGLAAGDSVVSYKSSNKKIFTVSKSGKITAKKKVGTAKLTITLASGHEMTIDVKVQKKAVKTNKIIVAKKNLMLNKGANYTLQPVLNPITSLQKITYSSSKKKVASVNAKGVITAKKKGTAKITVKSGSEKVVVKVKVK